MNVPTCQTAQGLRYMTSSTEKRKDIQKVEAPVYTEFHPSSVLRSAFPKANGSHVSGMASGKAGRASPNIPGTLHVLQCLRKTGAVSLSMARSHLSVFWPHCYCPEVFPFPLLAPLLHLLVLGPAILRCFSLAISNRAQNLWSALLDC